NGINSTNSIVCNTNSDTATWVLRYGKGSEERVETRGVVVSLGTTTNRVETVDIRYAGAANPTYRATETYRKYPWGFELIETRLDPDNNPGTANDLVTSISYHTNSGAPFSYGKPLSFVYPDGYWEKRLYYEDIGWWLEFGANYPGTLEYVITPNQDLPANPDSADIVNSTVQNHWTSGDWGEFSDIYNMDTNTDWSSTGAETVFRRQEIGQFLSEDASGLLEVREMVEHSRPEASAGFGYLGTRTVTFTEDAGFGYYPHPVHSFDGTGAIQESYYHGGVYNPATRTFVVGANGPGAGPDWRQSTIFWNYDQRAADEDAANGRPWVSVSRAESEPLYYGAWLGRYRNWRESLIYQKGSLVQKEQYVFTGVNGVNEPLFELVALWIYKNDALGHLTNITWFDGTNGVSRVIYEADYRGTNTFDGELKLWERDETGTKAFFTYDSLKRLVSVRKEGVAAGNYPSQADITTSITYDAQGRVLAQVRSAAGLALTNSFIFDLAGRVKSETDANALTTQFVYESGGRRTTKILPNGLTEIRENYLDRRLKSLTGTAVVNEYHQRRYNTPANHVTVPYGCSVSELDTIHYGSTNSPRVVVQGTDFCGRLVRTERPDYPSGEMVVESLAYNNPWEQSALPKYVWTSNRSLPLQELFYDLDGQTNLLSIPVGESSGGVLASDERITRSIRRFARIGSGWFRCETNLIYLVASNSTPTVHSIRIERLNGFSNGATASQITTWDADTNATTISTYIDRQAKTVTLVRVPANSILTATNVILNGLLVSESTHSIAKPSRYSYDSLGRNIAVTDPLGFVTLTTYNTAGQVDTKTDPTGLTTWIQYYGNGEAGAGQIKSVTAGGKTTYYAYTNFGVWRIWGDVPYPEERIYSQYGEQVELRTFRGGTGWNQASWPTGSGTADKTIWSFDGSSGLLLSKTDAANRSVSYTYTNRFLHTRTWARGIVTTNWYNDLGELQAIRYSDSTPSVDFVIKNDLGQVIVDLNRSGLPQVVSDASGVWRLLYDHAGRTISATCTNGALFSGLTISNHFNRIYGREELRLIGLTCPITNKFTYDSWGRLEGVSNGVYSASYGYLPNSDLLQTTTCKNNGSAVLTTTRAWEHGFRLGGIVNSVDENVVTSHAYQYDNLNRRTRAALEDGSEWV
ncbi:MAG TPA: RHS repeat domain-containing protein, partial [Clostridia bacterium]|nr:RHS repeat domain-containing protein [Clostridia bacterium]